jgi:uncharacterized protein (TIGR02099 family)
LLALFAFAAIVLWLRHSALPNIESYRGEIVSSIESASGMAVTVKSLRGGWEGLRPSVSMEGFTLSDRKGRSALAFERAEVTLSWYALLLGEVRFHKVEFDGPELVLRRGTDGLIYLADKPLNQAGPGDGEFSRWLLEQPRLQVHRATLVWRDDLAGAPEVRLSDVEIALRRSGDRHHAALVARPPGYLAAKIDLRADLAIARGHDAWSVTGTVYAETMHADVARLREHLPVPATLRNGVGSLRVWAEFVPAGVKEVVADLSLRDAKAQFASDLLPLELASVSGRAIYRAQPRGFYVGTEGLRLRTRSGLETRQGSFSVLSLDEGKGPRGEVRADGIDLKVAAALLDYFPVPRETKAQVMRFAPRGRISNASFTWTGASPAVASAFTVRAGFEDLSVNAVEGYPGVTGLNGSLEGTRGGGQVTLASKHVALEIERLFRAPLTFDTLDARATWKREGKVLQVALEEVNFANADAQGRVSGTWRSLPDSPVNSPGYAKLQGTLARAEARSVADYLPNGLAVTRDWLDRAILSGHGANVKFEVDGDLWHFPFQGGKEGRFLVEADLLDGRLRYHPDWPSIDAIAGTVRFDNTRMEILAERASIYSSQVTRTSAVIADLLAHPPLVEVRGQVDTAGTDTARFLRESPLINGPGAFTRAVAVEGPARLVLGLHYPVYGMDPVRVDGEYTFNGARASVGKSLAIEGVMGKLKFSEKGVRAQELAGTMFGQPALLRIASQPDGAVLTSLEGRITMPALGAYVPEPIAARFDGGLDWRAKVFHGREGTDLTIESDLKGLDSRLPEPFAKSAAEARELTLSIKALGSENEVTLATLAGGAYGRFGTRGAPGQERWHAALKFGGPLDGEPVKDGIWLYGSLPGIDLDAWQSVFPARPAQGAAAADSGPGLQGFDLRLAKVRFTGREFSDLTATMERSDGQWRGRLDGPQLAGDVTWRGEGQGRVFARLSRLVMRPEQGAAAARQPATGDASDLPALDIVAERFEFKNIALGRLELQAQVAGEDWRIEKLDIRNEHAQFHATGAWRRTAAGPITTLNLNVQASDLNGLLGQFGYGDYVKRGTGRLAGNLVWPGFPYEFELGNLQGSFKLEASRGQFAKIEPGAGKLLGLLSLQSLPRRATFDFRDVFSDGFAFEAITASVKVARGNLLTDDFEIKGPSAFVSMAGEVSMPRETQTLTLRVVPEVGETIALAATVFATPVVGLSTLLVSKLLQNPLGKAVAYEYLVTGTWDNPSVTPISVPPPKAAAAAPAGGPLLEGADSKTRTR